MVTQHKYASEVFRRATQLSKELKLNTFTMKELQRSVRSEADVVKARKTRDKAVENKGIIWHYLSGHNMNEVTAKACNLIVRNQESVIINLNSQIDLYYIHNQREAADESSM